MKLYILSILSVLFFFSPLFGENKEPVKLNVHVDQSLTQEAQWVYWFYMTGNEYNIVDSCYLQKDETTFSFEHTFPENEEYYSTWLTFLKNGPFQTVVFVKDGDDIEVYIDKDTGIFPKGKGSVSVEEFYRNVQETDILREKITRMEDSLAFTVDEKMRNEIEHTLDSLNAYMKWGIRLKFMERSRCPNGYFDYLMVVSDYLSSEKIDSLAAIMKDRFPDSEKIQMYPERKRYPVATEKSKQVWLRFDSMFSERYGTPMPQNERREIDSTAIRSIQAYGIGDKVSGISLTGLDGERVDLAELNTDYVLVDFWASWCGPCRREIPYLKAVLNKYPDDLTVYAISIDSNESQWRDSIKSDKSEVFTHVFAGYDTQESLVVRTRFGVKAIPANFLLDKEGTIIAVNLRQDGLMKEMDGREE